MIVQQMSTRAWCLELDGLLIAQPDKETQHRHEDGKQSSPREGEVDKGANAGRVGNCQYQLIWKIGEVVTGVGGRLLHEPSIVDCVMSGEGLLPREVPARLGILREVAATMDGVAVRHLDGAVRHCGSSVGRF